MSSFSRAILFACVGLIYLHAVSSQSTANADQTTVIWQVSTNGMDPSLTAESTTAPPADTTTAAEVMPADPGALPATTTTAATPAPPLAPEPTQGQTIPNTQTSAQTGMPPDPALAGSNIQLEVTETVKALLNETGYAGSTNDANVQVIVKMLMNGTVPTDADLIRLGILPAPSPSASVAIETTTPPPYTFPVAPGTGTGIDLIGLGTGGTGSQAIPSSPTPAPFNPMIPPTPNNALLPKPGNPTLPPMTDLMNMLNPNGMPGGMPGGMQGMGPGPAMPQTPSNGILDQAYQQQQQQQHQRQQGGMNPMMMMMMFNPELMDQMMSGENPFLTMMMMQAMQPQQRRPQTPVTSPIGVPPGMGNLGGMPSQPSAGSGGLMDLMNSGMPGGMPPPGGATDLMSMMTGAAPGSGPMTNMVNPTPGGFPAPAPGGPMPDLTQLLNSMGPAPSAAGTGAPTGGLDMSAFLNMVNPQPAVGPTPTMTDPFATGTMG